MLTALTYSCFADPGILSAEELYRRCFAQMVRQRPQATSQDLRDVQSGKLDPVQACLKLINGAELQDDGQPRDQNTGREVLRTFQSLHSSWFPQHDMVVIETDFPTTNFYDTGEMGYHLTWALLKPGQKYSQVVTRKETFRAIRDGKIKPTYFMDGVGTGHVAQLNERPWSKSDDGPDFNPALTSFGPFLGIEIKPAFKQLAHNVISGEQVKMDPAKSLGGGILGTPAFLLVSSTMKSYTDTDGGIKMHRGWSKAVMKDLLCRDLPALDPNDAFDVDGRSLVSFRNHKSCMHCHSTIEPMAGVLRGVAFVPSRPGKPWEIFTSRTVAQHSVLPSSKDYARTAPEGRLYFRDYKGELIDQKITSVDDLGSKLAALDDLYLCAAKRYFEFFTGVDVNLRDFSKDSKAALQSPDVKYRDFVLQQALLLKKDQNVKSLIGRILASDFYKRKSYGVNYAATP